MNTQTVEQSAEENQVLRQLWAVEFMRRRDEVRSGKVKTIQGDVALNKIRQLLARGRGTGCF